MRATWSVLCFIVCHCTMAQVPIFHRIGTREGLVFREVHTMVRDRDGVLWIGTAMGLSRYDGAGFRTFTTRDGLPAPRVRDIAVDTAGMLWLATPKGLAKLDPRSHMVRSWLIDTISEDRERTNHLMRILPLRDGRVVCASRERTWLLDPSGEAVKELRDSVLGGLVLYGRVLMADSADRGFWISTKENGLVYWDVEGNRAMHARWNPGDHPLLAGLRITAMHRDTLGDLWCDDLETGGLMHYRKADGKLRRWPHLPGHPELRLPSGALTIHRDRKGRIWMGGWDLRMVLFDPQDSSLVRLPFRSEDPATMPNPVMSALVEDEHGVIWIGTHMGLAVHDPRQLQYELLTYEGDHQLMHELGKNAALEDEQGVCWFATESGLLKYDLRTRTSALIKFAPEDPMNWFANALTAIAEHGGLYWIGGRDGLWTYDPRSGAARKTRYPFLDRGAGTTTHVSWLFNDGQGDLWGWAHEVGLFRIAHGTDSLTPIPVSTEAHALRPGVLHGAAEGRDGTIWFGHDSEGLIQWDRATGQFRSLRADVLGGRVASGRVLTLTVDVPGNIWFVADGAGLVKYGPSTGGYTTYDERHGMPVPAAHSMLFDGRGRLWVGTLKGLSLFDPALERFENVRVDVKRDLQFDDAGFCSLRLRDGSFLFTLDEMIVHFDGDAYEGAGPPDAPSVRELMVNGAHKAIPVTGVLGLPHHEDRLTLRFTTFEVPGRIVRYALREAGDSLWTESAEPDVTLDDLAPGAYRFLLRTMANDGRWSPVSELQVEVLPPWWQRTWARLLGALVLAAAIVLAFRLRLNWIRKRERKEESIARTVNELKLQALRAQMDPHFVFNCLNSVDRFILAEEKKKASHYLNRFARLIRLILQQSESTTVPLEREVEMLRYYLELESIRFEVPFAWEVKVDPLLLEEPLELPTMLVQPFVENAIWHGLQHKQGAGRVEVAFRRMEEGVECTIEDDGVGRAASMGINKERSGVHRSMGMRVTTERIKLLTEQHQRTARIAIRDLSDATGRPTGTRVSILVPIEGASNE